MALFDVEGWGLDSNAVAPGLPTAKYNSEENVSKRKKEQKRKRDSKKRKKAREHDRERDEQEQEKEKEEEEAATGTHSSRSVPALPAVFERIQMDDSKLTPLQKKMLSKLSGSRFRWINEQLYTTDSANAVEMIRKQPELFDEYHKGFRSQVESWPENPVDIYTRQLVFRGVNRPLNSPGGLPGVYSGNHKKVVVADMGCGEAQLAEEVDKFTEYYKTDPKKALKAFKRKYGGDTDVTAKNRHLDVEMHSFDLKKVNDRITVADIRHVPMEDESCSVVIFCLSLMGTNFLDFVEEAKRILVRGGELWIAEIQSRLTDDSGQEFSHTLAKLGFKHRKTDTSNKMFTRFEFLKPIKPREADELEEVRGDQNEGQWLLKPCIYKRR